MADAQPKTGKAAVLEGMADHPAVKAIAGWNAEMP